MTAAPADYGFEEVRGNGSTEFIVTPPPLDRTTRFGASAMYSWLAFWAGLIAAIVVALVIGGGGLMFLLVFAGGTAGCYLWLRNKGRTAVSQVLKTSRIKVSAGGIELDGVHHARADIGGLWVQTPKGPAQQWETSSTVVAGSGMTGSVMAVASSANAAAAQAGAAAGQAWAAHVNKRAFGVRMRYGARDIALVDAIEQGVAEALATKIHAALTEAGA